MRLIRAAAALAVLAASFVLGGCTSVPMADPSQDAALKRFPPPKPGLAGLYIYRNEVFGGAIKLPLVLDGQSVGASAPKTYFFTEIAPGRHTVVSQAENVDTLNFDAVAGRHYYVWQEVKMGALQARTKLSLVGEAEGRKGVLESALATSSLAPVRSMPATAPAPAGVAPVAGRGPGRFDGQWAGSLRCGAFVGLGKTESPEPFTVRVQLAVKDNYARMRRGNATYQEESQGHVSDEGRVTLTGQGAMTRQQNLPWTSQFHGRFAPDRFTANGTLTGSNGIVVRQCDMTLARDANPG